MVLGHMENDRIVQRVTNLQQTTLDGTSFKQVEDIIKQGPVLPGRFISLGTFRKMLQRLRRAVLDRPDGLDEEIDELVLADFVEPLEYLEVRVMGITGNYDFPVGAFRTFRATLENGCIEIRSPMTMTEQMNGRSQRLQVEEWLEECMQL
jgi:hypothetical protein